MEGGEEGDGEVEEGEEEERDIGGEVWVREGWRFRHRCGGGGDWC